MLLGSVSDTCGHTGAWNTSTLQHHTPFSFKVHSLGLVLVLVCSCCFSLTMVRITLTNEIGLASQLEVSASETIANLKVKQNTTCLCVMTRSRHLTPISRVGTRRRTLQALVAAEMGVPISQQQLMFNGHELADGEATVRTEA